MAEQKGFTFKDVTEVISRQLRSGTVQFRRWREDADRSLGVSTLPEFLLIVPDEDIYFELVSLVSVAPYPRATAAKCGSLTQVVELVASLRVPLLILINQPKFLNSHPYLFHGEDGHLLLDLLGQFPELHVKLYSSHICVRDLFEGEAIANLIEHGQFPIDPWEFHRYIARLYGLDLPLQLVRNK